jgi:twitching motility protein PilU
MTQPYDIAPLFALMVEHGASDLYLTVGHPATLRVSDKIRSVGEALTRADVESVLGKLLTDEQRMEFESTLEFNNAFAWNDMARFRVNAFVQQQNPGLVIRQIQVKIPTFSELDLPDAYQKLIMEKRGLVLVVGPTGSGKSSSLAAMIGYRNEHSQGHIITIEDPIEFLHSHKGCIVTQRDVGIDTFSFGMALKNALRQRPDVVLIGEIRDRETMEHAINFAETGHLCVATLHANNTNQAIERVLSFFPEEKHKQVLMNLALNLRGILSQRLLHGKHGKRCLAVEILLNEGLIRQLIEEGKIKDIRMVLEKNSDIGMRTFDQSLIEMFRKGLIDEEQALAESDNPSNLRLAIKQTRIIKATSGSTEGGREHFRI